jgi:HSP20 family molecular chaperone IbpA
MIAPASALPPEGADPIASAKFHHGVLQITLPASAAMAPKRIEIQAGAPALT